MTNRAVPCCNCKRPHEIESNINDASNSAVIYRTYHVTKLRRVEIDKDGCCVHCGFYPQYRIPEAVDESLNTFMARYEKPDNVVAVFESIYDLKDDRLVDNIRETIPLVPTKWK